MKRCRSIVTISGVKVRCKLPLNHEKESLGLTSGPLGKHEHWQTSKAKGGFRNRLLSWWAKPNDWSYGKLQADARGGPYAEVVD